MKKLLLFISILFLSAAVHAACTDVIYPQGNPYIIVGTAVTLSDASGSGTWSSSNTEIATIDPSTGRLSPVSPGYVTITHRTTALCFSSKRYLVNGVNGPCITVSAAGAGALRPFMTFAGFDYPVLALAYTCSYQLGSDSTISIYNILSGKIIVPPTVDTMFIFSDSTNARVRNAVLFRTYLRTYIFGASGS